MPSTDQPESVSGVPSKRDLPLAPAAQAANPSSGPFHEAMEVDRLKDELAALHPGPLGAPLHAETSTVAPVVHLASDLTRRRPEGIVSDPDVPR